MANTKKTTKKNSSLQENEILISSERENKTMTVDRDDFEKEAEYFKTANPDWDWKEVTE